MNPNITNVLNPKALEKQIKIYDTRLQTLQEEVDELQRMRAACQLLLGGTPVSAEAQPEAAGEVAKNAKRAKSKNADGSAATGGGFEEPIAPPPAASEEAALDN